MKTAFAWLGIAADPERAHLQRQLLCMLLSLAFATVAFATRLQAQEVRVGKPLVHNYNHRDFGAEVQSWDVVQGDSGLMYFANNQGVLEYDGRTWRLIELPSHLDVRSLLKDSRGPLAAIGGRIYAGATGDFGYLGPDAAGQLQFHSLLPPEARRDKTFDQIFTPALTPTGVAFHARNKLCLWTNEQLTCRETDISLSKLFSVGDRNFVQKKTGLMEMTGWSLRPVPGGERFTDEEITLVLPYASGREERLLVGARGFHLYIQSGGAFVPFALDTRPRHANDEELIRGAVLPDGSFVLATRRRGALIIDRDGRVIRQIDEAAGLQENHVHGVWPDRDGGLWLTLQSGVSRVDVSSPFAILDEDVGLEREWREVIKHQGTLYVRGYRGLFASITASLRFKRVPEIEAPVWATAVAGNRFLASSKDGVYELHGTRPRRIATYASMPMAMYRSRSDPDRVFVGLVEGIASLRLTDGAWVNEGRIEGIDDTITSIAEDAGGALWMVSQRQRILRVEFLDKAAPGTRESKARSPRVHVSSFGRGTLSGRVTVREAAGRVAFLADDAIYEFDAGSEQFLPSPIYAALPQTGRGSFSWLAEDARGDLWVASRKPGAIDILRRQLDGRFVADNTSLLQMPAWSVYPEPDGRVVWISVPDHLLRYDLTIQTHPGAFATLIRKVRLNDDTTVFGGAGTSLHAGGRDGAQQDLAFPYRSNSLHFEFAAPRFDDSERNEFQSFLEGFDARWSGWSRDRTRSYTNLPPGAYQFQVRARDARGVVGSEATFAFSVLRPWYRSWFAYTAYALFACAALVMAWQLQMHRAHQRMQRDLVGLELEKLREMDRMKSRFFTDISHEFRTPLTLILGPIGQMFQQTASHDVRQQLLLVRQNAEYLLRLISQILDLSKLESGKMRMRAAKADLVSVLHTVVVPFAAMAEQQELTLRRELPATPVVLYFDREVVEKILNNLLANALKFTPRGGTVRIKLRDVPPERASASEGWKFGYAEIVIEDTGIGIERDQLSQIFNRFYQVESGRSREGIGVGLALVKELVELHGGTIAVESELGKGTTFAVRLPKGRDHLTADEVVHDPAVSMPMLPMPMLPHPSDAPHALEALHPQHLLHPPHASEHALPLRGDQPEDARTVLIVEDHAGVRAFLRDQLQPHYRILEAKDGAEALDIATSALPDLVLSDVMMTPVNGFDFCKSLKHRDKTCHIPVVLLTARAGHDDRLAGLDTGADAYVIKPFEPSELLLQIRNLINQRRLLRERFSSAVVLKPSEMAVQPMDAAFLTRVLAVIEQGMSDPEFDVERLGREVGLSRSQLHRKLRALTHQPPTLLIRSIRLQRAAELLKQDAGSVAEVAYRVGFSSQAYFAKCFREQFGHAPKEYSKAGVRPE
jgi:signal transduction histidine kinase/DNA-binding response OmpR family regulator